ncbi:hypothetical protein EON64_20635, partial [archaeon]
MKIPDLLEEASLLDWAGLSVGRGDLYRLFLSIKKLAETLSGDVERLRWVGRVSTRGRPYYVVEGVAPDEEEGVDEAKQEGKAGANKYAYWVTQSVESAQWTRLPSVSMEHVVKARQFRRLLTGDL